MNTHKFVLETLEMLSIFGAAKYSLPQFVIDDVNKVISKIRNNQILSSIDLNHIEQALESLGYAEPIVNCFLIEEKQLRERLNFNYAKIIGLKKLRMLIKDGQLIYGFSDLLIEEITILREKILANKEINLLELEVLEMLMEYKQPTKSLL